LPINLDNSQNSRAFDLLVKEIELRKKKERVSFLKTQLLLMRFIKPRKNSFYYKKRALRKELGFLKKELVHEDYLDSLFERKFRLDLVRSVEKMDRLDSFLNRRSDFSFLPKDSIEQSLFSYTSVYSTLVVYDRPHFDPQEDIKLVYDSQEVFEIDQFSNVKTEEELLNEWFSQHPLVPEVLQVSLDSGDGVADPRLAGPFKRNKRITKTQGEKVGSLRPYVEKARCFRRKDWLSSPLRFTNISSRAPFSEYDRTQYLFDCWAVGLNSVINVESSQRAGAEPSVKNPFRQHAQVEFVGYVVDLDGQELANKYKMKLLANRKKFQLGAIWQTLGDGLCVLHSVMSCNPKWRYLMMLNWFYNTEKISVFYEHFLKPEVRKMLESEDFKRTMLPCDVDVLRRWSSNIGPVPASLDVQATVFSVATFYNFPKIPEILDRDNLDNVTRFVNEAMSSKTASDWDRFIYFTPNHASYATRTMAIAHFNNDRDYTDAYHNLWGDAVSPSEEKRLEALLSALTFKSEIEKKCEATKIRNTALKADVKVLKIEQLNTKRAIEEVEGTNSSLRKDLSKIISGPKDDLQSDKNVKYVSRSSIYLDSKSREIAGHFSTNLKTSPEFANILKPLDVRLFESPHDYPHAGLRIIADKANFDMIKTGLNSGSFVLEHAAKYHKTTKWLHSSIQGLAKQYFFTRPMILPGVDDDYVHSHPFDLYSCDFYAPYNPYQKLGELLTAPNGGDFFHVLADVMYYQSAWEDLLKAPLGSHGAFSVGNYPKTEGRYSYFDDEGFFEIRNNRVWNNPTYNGKGYTHPFQSVPTASFSYKVPSGDLYLNCTPQIVVKTGNHSSHSWYLFSIDPEPFYDIHNLFESTENITIETIPKQSRVQMKVINGVISYDNEETFNLTSQVIFVDWRVYDFLSEKYTYKSANKDSTEEQFKFLFKSYQTLYKNSRVHGVLRYDTFLSTALYLHQERTLETKFFHSSLDAPIHSNINNKNVILRRPWWYQRFFIWASRLITDPGTSEVVDSFVNKQQGTVFTTYEGRRAGGYQDNDLEGLPERHYDQAVSKRFYHPVGNSSINVTDWGREASCTCKTSSYTKVINVDTGLHFGSCEKNLDACIFARGFNTILNPHKNFLFLFNHYVADIWWPRHEKCVFESIDNLTSEDLSFENFLRETIPSKRKLYKHGFEDFLKNCRIDSKFELFVKPNEIHYDSIVEVRPRMIFNPSPSMKAVGAYLARIMIKLMKKIEPGFISGYSMSELADKMTDSRAIGKFIGDTVYSYDGASHDAHQDYRLIESVDHFLIKLILPRILSKVGCAVPDFLLSEVLKALLPESYKFFTRLGMKGEIKGTVFSGHPTLTTLFNTTRTLLYNRFAMWFINPALEECSEFWAAGDDLLSWTPRPFDSQNFRRILGGESGFKGLGQNAKDFKTGFLEEHTFLSKIFVVMNDKIGVIPVGNRIYKAGCVISRDSPLTIEEHRLLQWICNADLPKSLAIFRERFTYGDVSKNVSSKMRQLLDYDWAYKLRAKNRSFPEDIDEQAYMVTDALYILKAWQDLPSTEESKLIFRPRAGGLQSCTFSKNFLMPRNSKTSRNVGNRKRNPNTKNSLKPLVKAVAKLDKDVKREIKEEKNDHLALTRYGLSKANKRMMDSSSRSSWLDQHHHAEYLYALGLLCPWDRINMRVPQPLPVPTATCCLKGVLSVTASASGYFVAFLNPWAGSGNSVLYYNNNVLFTSDAYQFQATIVSTIAGLNTSTNMCNYRIVSAGLKARDLSPALNMTGVMSYGCVPYQQIVTAACNADTIRDSLLVTTVPSVDANGYLGGVYLPTGPDAFILQTYSTTLFTHVAPVVYLSGCVPGAVISLEYCVNYEFIPGVSQTDLLAVESPLQGTSDGALLKVGALISMDPGAQESVRATVKGSNERTFGSRMNDLLSKVGRRIGSAAAPVILDGLGSLALGLIAGSN